MSEGDIVAVEDFVSGAYILAVDDFSVIRRIVVNQLRAKEAFVDEAPNGLVALDKLRMAFENNVPYDLVFLDIEMPVMDGVEFLTKLRADPNLSATPVIILSSHADQYEINQCITLGISDYIIKPVTKERLYMAVSKALAGRKRVADLDLQETPEALAEAASTGGADEARYAKLIFQKLETIERLPTLPVVLDRIKELTADPNANNERIANIMEDDPSMMANVLKLANSALYGARERIDSLQSAITRLGLQAVRNIATTMGVLQVFQDSEQEVFDHREFCRHSICTGIAMQVIYEACRDRFSVPLTKDFLHLAGLLHDVGKIVIIQFFQDEYFRAVDMAKSRSLPLFEAESKALGTHHSEVGAWLGRKWNLATNHISVIRFHHAPMMVGEDDQNLVMLCHAANYICNSERIGDGGDITTPMFDQRALAQIGLKTADIPDIVKRVQQESKHSELLISLLK